MAYRRFKLPELSSAPATVATVATLQAADPKTVASVANVADPEPETAAGDRSRTVATVASVAADTSGQAIWDDNDWRTYFDERAGIAEFDGGKSRGEAEAIAFECCIVEWLNRHPATSESGHCDWCNQPEQDHAIIVPFGTAEHGHTWLHADCWPGWHKRRRAEALAGLIALGIDKSTAEP